MVVNVTAPRAVGSLECGELLARLKAANWATAMTNLRSEWKGRGADATARAAPYGGDYAGTRAAMVFDCVMSRRRRYESVVRPLVADFKLTPNAASLSVLAEHGPGSTGPSRSYPFRRGDALVIQQVAAALERFRNERTERHGSQRCCITSTSTPASGITGAEPGGGSGGGKWWAHLDSNQRPLRCQRSARTN